ncbi:GTPase HflX [Dyadobacter sp. LHD-138]|uniref:GTPase HflX n=1 Tax=Dyadobacter sp. LHD-138 TaxID=3071413 RepID=UPI0027E0B795|nr:GTPase HflX [Dyadobacter sp. LHD-138]MDQ6482547.1 GTPase HflX [Dyadobacter sp. LHD-138]
MISKKELFDTSVKQLKAVLIAVSTQKQNTEKTKEYLSELAFLAETIQVNTVHSFIQKLQHADIRTYVGKGKLEEIAAFINANPVDMIICDDDLSPAQVRNLHQVLGDIKIIDRGFLILEIFAMRSQTAQSKLAVELARCQYMYPRLSRMWTHLSRQGGAGTGSRGPGETELETDRRMVKDRIAFFKDKLEKVDVQSQTRRKERNRLVRVALVGYTNVGKSTLMRQLSKADVHVENTLFATIDSTVRQVQLNNITFLLTDTVGFIRKLPATLIESFKSTLDEVREADILLLVEDISNPSFSEHLEVVNKTLAELGAWYTPTLLVFNKIDIYKSTDSNALLNSDGCQDQPTTTSLDQFRKSYVNKMVTDTVYISAEKKENLLELKQMLFALIQQKHLEIHPDRADPDLVSNIEREK